MRRYKLSDEELSAILGEHCAGNLYFQNRADIYPGTGCYLEHLSSFQGHDETWTSAVRRLTGATEEGLYYDSSVQAFTFGYRNEMSVEELLTLISEVAVQEVA